MDKKETSKWVLGGDGITNIKPSKDNLAFAKEFNRKRKIVRKPAGKKG